METKVPLLKTLQSIKSNCRFINKNGDCNLRQPVSKKQKYHFLEYTQLIQSTWTFTVSVFLLIIASSCFIFGIIWWLICLAHGDFEPNHLPEFQKANNHTPCVLHVHSFASCLLFSIETQHTVGYGIKAPTDECPEAIFVNAIQCILGFAMQGVMSVVILSKMTLPKRRSQTLLFSKNAVFSSRNKKLVFMFRIGDMRKNHIINTKVQAFLFQFEASNDTTTKKKNIQYYQQELDIRMDGCKDGLFFNWPVIVYHEITSKSPLFDVVLLNNINVNKQLEIVVVLEGTVLSTGQVIQTKSSYVLNEIIWGGMFEPMLSYNTDRMEYEADFSKFDEVYPIDISLIELFRQ